MSTMLGTKEGQQNTDYSRMSPEQLVDAPLSQQRLRRAEYEPIMRLLSQPSVLRTEVTREVLAAERGVPPFREFCLSQTRNDCLRQRGGEPCQRVHFKRIIQDHTDIALGDCSFLDTCRKMNVCRSIHYELDLGDGKLLPPAEAPEPLDEAECPAQWICCDVRAFDMAVLGKFNVIMADPPWDIHMNLPYATMTDCEMRALPVPQLMDEGLIFLWVTGRAMELGRACLKAWGYRFVEELIWVKTNQLQRLIRTGRTGHWFNHSKEHCIIGIKGNPRWVTHIDCDVVVSEMRETSRKPEEVYRLINRLCPHGRKLELFGRQHNCRPRWLTLGNELEGVRLWEPDLIARFNAKYPGHAVVDCRVSGKKARQSRKRELPTAVIGAHRPHYASGPNRERSFGDGGARPDASPPQKRVPMDFRARAGIRAPTVPHAPVPPPRLPSVRALPPLGLPPPSAVPLARYLMQRAPGGAMLPPGSSMMAPGVPVRVHFPYGGRFPLSPGAYGPATVRPRPPAPW